MIEKGKEAHDQEAEQERYKLQIDLSPESYRRLRKLRKQADLRTNAEVVRNALKLYAWFIEQRSENLSVLLAKEDKEEKKYEIVGKVEIIF